MAHPYASVRQSKVEHSRASGIAKGHASGGAVTAGVGAKSAPASRAAAKPKFAVGGAVSTPRLDRPSRASGGAVRGKKGNTTVNVIVAPQGGKDAPDMPPMPPPMPPRPAMPPMPPGPPPGAGGMPPMPMGGAPIRSAGGRAYASGGAVKPGPAYEEGKREGTQVSHAPGKNDLAEMNRGRVITYKTGGAVEAPRGRKGMAPKLPGGGRGGLARLAKAARAKRA